MANAISIPLAHVSSFIVSISQSQIPGTRDAQSVVHQIKPVLWRDNTAGVALSFDAYRLNPGQREAHATLYAVICCKPEAQLCVSPISATVEKIADLGGRSKQSLLYRKCLYLTIGIQPG